MQRKTKKSILITVAYGEKTLQHIFGTSVRVKLDLFYAIKRFTKELPKYFI